MELPGDLCTSLVALTLPEDRSNRYLAVGKCKISIAHQVPRGWMFNYQLRAFLTTPKRTDTMYLISTKDEQDGSEPSVSEPWQHWPLDINTFFETDVQHSSLFTPARFRLLVVSRPLANVQLPPVMVRRGKRQAR
jgi:hypothetical protein